MTFFHLAGAPLEPGSVIRPGNWGRVVRLNGWRHPSALREMALEDARRQRWPDRPSRLNCAFVCMSEVEARFYQSACVPFHVVHEVALVDDAAQLFQTSWDLVKPEKVEFGPDWCDRYWDGETWRLIVGVGEGPHVGLHAREGLTTSPLRIVGALD